MQGGKEERGQTHTQRQACTCRGCPTCGLRSMRGRLVLLTAPAFFFSVFLFVLCCVSGCLVVSFLAVHASSVLLSLHDLDVPASVTLHPQSPEEAAHKTRSATVVFNEGTQAREVMKGWNQKINGTVSDNTNIPTTQTAEAMHHFRLLTLFGSLLSLFISLLVLFLSSEFVSPSLLRSAALERLDCCASSPIPAVPASSAPRAVLSSAARECHAKSRQGAAKVIFNGVGVLGLIRRLLLDAPLSPLPCVLPDASVGVLAFVVPRLVAVVHVIE